MVSYVSTENAWSRSSVIDSPRDIHKPWTRRESVVLAGSIVAIVSHSTFHIFCVGPLDPPLDIYMCRAPFRDGLYLWSFLLANNIISLGVSRPLPGTLKMSAHYPSSGAAGQQPPRGPGNPSDMPPLGSSGSYAPQISAADAYRYMPQPTGQDVTASIDTEMTDSYAPYANGYEHCNGHSEPLVNGVGDHVGYYPEDESDQQTSSSQDYSTRRNWSDG